jgi:uncharacterized membrane protein YhfC
MIWHYLAYTLNGLLMVSLPIAVGIFITKRYKLDWGLWFIGAAIFVISQIGHIPFNSFVLQPFLAKIAGLPDVWQMIILAISLGLSAGLFEEGSRYFMFRWWAKDARTWEKSILAGAGHGGAEAFILGLLSLVVLVQMAAYQNADFRLFPNITRDQAILAQSQVSSYWSTPWYLSLFGFLERALTIPIQISFSVIVYQAIARRRFAWVLLAIIYHAAVDAGALFIGQNAGVYWAEAFVAFFAVVSIYVIWTLRDKSANGLLQKNQMVAADDKGKHIQMDLNENIDTLENAKFL